MNITGFRKGVEEDGNEWGGTHRGALSTLHAPGPGPGPSGPHICGICQLLRNWQKRVGPCEG